MPSYGPERFLVFTGWLLLLCTASTFCWWAAAQALRCEFRSLMSALACSMRWFFYSVCLLCILVTLVAFGIAPGDPRSQLFGWIQIGGTVWIAAPCCWRSFREKPGLKLAATYVLGLVLCGGLLFLAMRAAPGVEHFVTAMPSVFSKTS
ncbi:MAG: hypothetical protein V3T86_03405 [Planctomycetota bacterium]